MAANDAGTVSLAEIRAKGFTLDVYEALAVVQAVCRDILESDNPVPPARLELDRVFISDDGTVTATAAAGEDEAAGIQTMGRLLAQLLPSVDFLLLRPRVVAKATATPPGYASLEEFSRALGSYQRPGGTETLKALYDRFKKRSGGSPLLELGIETRPEPGTSPNRARTFLRMAIAFLVLAGLGAGGYWAWTHRTRFLAPSRTASASASDRDLAAASSDPAAATASDSQTAKGDTPQLTGTAPGASTTPGSSAPAVGNKSAGATGGTTQRRPAAGGAAATGTQPISRAAGSVVPDGGRPPAASGPAPAPMSGSSERSSTSPAPADVDGVAIASFDTLSIYSNRNGDVEPPTVISPQRLLPVPGSQQPDRPAIEILVNELGTVDSVKAHLPPKTLGESVVVTSALSAAKSWRFRPALREGKPVRYRLLVTFSER